MSDAPFEVGVDVLQARLDEFVSTVFASLSSEFMVLPKGPGFIDYPTFEKGYEALKQATTGFTNFTADIVLPAILQTPIATVVLRTMLGFTAPEWAYVATQRTGVQVPQGAVRTLDRRVRIDPLTPIGWAEATQERVAALVQAACALLTEGVPPVPPDRIHRLDKADTRAGLAGMANLGALGVPYPMLLYERFMGRPFAGHKDSVSELIGDVLEVRIEQTLSNAGISFRKTKRAERLPGFDQAPDFIVPDEFNPMVVIEAKIAEDDGTARDKVTRVQHLAHLASEGQPPGSFKFEVVACISGRGFGIRREDMKKLLLATRGKVFTMKTLDRLVECTSLRGFKSR